VLPRKLLDFGLAREQVMQFAAHRLRLGEPAQRHHVLAVVRQHRLHGVLHHSGVQTGPHRGQAGPFGAAQLGDPEVLGDQLGRVVALTGVQAPERPVGLQVHHGYNSTAGWQRGRSRCVPVTSPAK
jgi:hypothetical protein